MIDLTWTVVSDFRAICGSGPITSLTAQSRGTVRKRGFPKIARAVIEILVDRRFLGFIELDALRF